jgi:hypothetical protein
MAKNNNKGIQIPDLTPPGKLSLSFEYYDDQAVRSYCLSKWQETEIALTLTRLKQVCQNNFHELCRQAKVYHFHPVDWSKTNEKDGFPNKSLKELDAYQFSILGVNNQKARVYGAYYKGIFFVVWFDYDHKITPSILKNT